MVDFVLSKGKDFVAPFDFKTETGQKRPLPPGLYRLVLEHGDFAREYLVNKGLAKTQTRITWSIPAKVNVDFEYSTLYYTLYLNDAELVRGIVRVQ